MHACSVVPSALAVVLMVSGAHAVDAAPVAQSPAAKDDEVGLGFEIGLNWHFPQRRPMEQGRGEFLAFDVDLGKVRVGYRLELADYRSKADDNDTGIADEVIYETQIHELRVIKSVYGDNAILMGLGVGMARIHATLPINAEGGPEGTMFDQLAPTGDLFVMLSPISGGKRLNAALNIILGYRLLLITPADPDQVGTDYQTDLRDMSGFHLGLSLSASF